MQNRKRLYSRLPLIFCLAAIIILGSAGTCFAGNVDKHVITSGLTSAGTQTVDSLTSANAGSTGDNINITVSGSNVTVSGNTRLAPIGTSSFKVRIAEQTGWGINRVEKVLSSSYSGGRYYFSGTLSTASLPDGQYTVFIYRGTDTRRFYRNCVLVVTNGQAVIQKYEKVQQLNTSAYETMSQYDKCNSFLDTRLTDIYLMLRRTAGASGSKLTDAEQAYVKTVADRITKYAPNDYEKAFEILKYIDDNFYYDRANPANGRAVTNPAVLIQRYESGQEAATNCVGYAALFAALARSEGIPTRVVYGVHRMDSAWVLNSNLKTANHHWTEFYYDGRWIIADADVGAGKYKELDGEFSKTDETLSYTFFDATPEQMAQNYIVLGLYKKPTLATPSVSITHTSSGNNKISWSSVTDATKYTVYRSETKYGEYNELKTVTAKYAIDLTAVTGIKYYYRVVAVPTNVNREASAMSKIVSGTDRLKVPVLSATSTKTSIKVSWPHVKGAVAYKVYRSQKSGSGYSLVKTVTVPSQPPSDEELLENEDGTVEEPETPAVVIPSTFSYTDKTAKKKTTYYYKVVAVHENSLASSAKSKAVSAKRKS